MFNTKPLYSYIIRSIVAPLVSVFVTVHRLIKNHVDVDAAAIAAIDHNELVNDHDTESGVKPVDMSCTPEGITSVIRSPDHAAASPNVTSILYLTCCHIVSCAPRGDTIDFTTHGINENEVETLPEAK